MNEETWSALDYATLICRGHRLLYLREVPQVNSSPLRAGTSLPLSALPAQVWEHTGGVFWLAGWPVSNSLPIHLWCDELKSLQRSSEVWNGPSIVCYGCWSIPGMSGWLENRAGTNTKAHKPSTCAWPFRLSAPDLEYSYIPNPHSLSRSPRGTKLEGKGVDRPEGTVLTPGYLPFNFSVFLFTSHGHEATQRWFFFFSPRNSGLGHCPLEAQAAEAFGASTLPQHPTIPSQCSHEVLKEATQTLLQGLSHSKTQALYLCFSSWSLSLVFLQRPWAWEAVWLTARTRTCSQPDLPHLKAVGPWESEVMLLSLSLFICQMG